MAIRLKRKSIILKTIQVGFSVLASRLLGMAREVIMVRYLGVNRVADAFVMAWRMPNSLRKIFAEGSLNAAFVPTFISEYKKDGTEAANSLMAATQLVIQGFLLLLCLFIFIKTELVLRLVAPGWFINPAVTAEHIALVIYLTRIVIFLILAFSTSALLGGALNSVSRFSVPASSQIVLNICFIIYILIGIKFNLSVVYLAYAMILNGIILVTMHIIAYKSAGFSFSRPTPHAWHAFKTVLFKFIPCSISGGALIINTFVDQSFATYIPAAGSVVLVYYANSFMTIPNSVFANAFSTVLLPQCAQIACYARKRLSFYLFEATKFIAWLTIPTILFMCFFAKELLETTLLSENFTMESVNIAASLLIIFTAGLFFISLNKIILQMFYACHKTMLPALICVGGATCNFALNLLFLKPFGIYGIPLATTIASGFQLLLYIIGLKKHLNFSVYTKQTSTFLGKYLLQLCCFLIPAYLFFKSAQMLSAYYFSERFVHIVFHTLVLWVWVMPLFLLVMYAIYRTRKSFGIRLYFIGAQKRSSKNCISKC